MRVFYRYLAGSIFFITIIVLLSANFLLAPGKKEIPVWVKNALEMSLRAKNCDLEIGEIKFVINPGEDKDYLQLDNIKIASTKKNRKNLKIGNIKQVTAKFKLLELFRHLDMHIDLDFGVAEFDIANSDCFDFDENNCYEEINDDLTQILMDNIVSAIRVSVLHFGNITCNNWQFNFPIAGIKQKFKINKAKLKFDYKKTDIKGNISYGLNKIKHQLDLKINFKKDKILESDFKFQEFPAHIFVNQSNLPGTAQLQNSKNRLYVSGHFRHIYNTKANSHNVRVKLDKIKGQLIDNEDNKKKYSLDNSKLNVTLSRDFVSVKNLNLNIEGKSNLRLSGAFSFKNYYRMLHLDMKTENFPIDFKNFFIPADTKFPTKDFTLNDIYEGSIDKAEAKIYLAPKYFTYGDINENIFEGYCNVSKVNVNYNDSFPDVKNLTAKIDLNTSQAEIVSKSGKVAGSSIVDLKYIIPLKTSTPMSLTANVFGPASDVVNYINDETLKDLQDTKVDLNKLGGEIDSDVKLEIPYSDEPIKFDVNAKASNVELSILDDYIRASNGEINAHFADNSLNLYGPIDIEGHNGQINYTINNVIDGTAKNDLQIDVKLTKDHTKQRLVEVTGGETNLHFTLLSNGNKGSYKVFSDLTDVGFVVTKGGIFKLRGDKGILNLSSEFENSLSNMKFDLTGEDNLNIKGTGKITKNYAQFDLNTIKFGDADCKLHYFLDDERSLTKISGNSLDLSHADFGKLLEKESDERASALNIEVDRATLKNKVQLNQVYLNTMCSTSQCYEGKMKGKLDDDSIVQMNLYNIGDKEKWILHSNNAGKVLSGFGINDNVKRGNLMASVNVSRVYSRQEQISVVEGNLHINKFSTTKMPFITRIVSFLSFPGIMSAISTNEIPFNSFDINFKYDNHIFSLNDGQAKGKYFDFTMKGAIDTEKQKINIGGKVVISMYGISTILNHMPIISNIFSRKDKVGGLFVAPYNFEQEY